LSKVIKRSVIDLKGIHGSFKRSDNFHQIGAIDFKVSTLGIAFQHSILKFHGVV
jgi:hypothetical protein